MDNPFALSDVNILEHFSEPVFCFTSDIEWSPEWAISKTLDLFDHYGVPLTPFLTHESKEIREHYGGSEMKPRVGLHPNFFPSSSHGNTLSEVIDFVCRLWPEAISFRSHSFFDNSHITDAFARRGFRYDSNLCLFLQPNCVPLQHGSGMLRFPVFWEDDTHFGKGLPFDLDIIKNRLESPGLKIFNTHPFLLALNIPNSDYYAAHKYLYKNDDAKSWRKFVFGGKGVCTFLEDVLDYIGTRGYNVTYLYDLFLESVGEKPKPEGMNIDFSG